MVIVRRVVPSQEFPFMHSRFAIALLPFMLPACDPASPVRTAAEPRPPVAAIHNGDDVGSCQWPSTVALTIGGTIYCTGTLIHPSYVLTAAHCIVQVGAPQVVAFGEDALAPERSAAVTGCAVHPGFDPSAEGVGVDLALCLLASPVQDVQPVPIAQGCELERLQRDGVVHIAGYGGTQGYWDPVLDQPSHSEGQGPKRYTPQAVYEVRNSVEEFDVVGLDEFSSACFGDSGGGAFMQLADGSWRLVGVAQSLFFPPGINPFDPETDGELPPLCGHGTTYGLIAPQMGWLESLTKVDMSPCFTPEGEWDEGPMCTPFPMQIHETVGSWANGCQGALGGELQCEGLVPPPEGSTGEAPDSTSGSDTSGSNTQTGGSTGSASAGRDGDDAAPVGTSSDGTEGDTAAGEAGGSGCGCRSSGNARALPISLGLFLLGRRRRRPRTAR
jgi:hypothetical protein